MVSYLLYLFVKQKVVSAERERDRYCEAKGWKSLCLCGSTRDFKWLNKAKLAGSSSDRSEVLPIFRSCKYGETLCIMQ